MRERLFAEVGRLYGLKIQSEAICREAWKRYEVDLNREAGKLVEESIAERSLISDELELYSRVADKAGSDGSYDVKDIWGVPDDWEPWWVKGSLEVDGLYADLNALGTWSIVKFKLDKEAAVRKEMASELSDKD